MLSPFYIEVKVAKKFRKERTKLKNKQAYNACPHPQCLEERHSQQLVGEFEGDQICLHRSCKFVFYGLVSSAISIWIILFGQHLRHEVKSKKKNK